MAALCLHADLIVATSGSMRASAQGTDDEHASALQPFLENEEPSARGSLS